MSFAIPGIIRDYSRYGCRILLVESEDAIKVILADAQVKCVPEVYHRDCGMGIDAISAEAEQKAAVLQAAGKFS